MVRQQPPMRKNIVGSSCLTVPVLKIGAVRVRFRGSRHPGGYPPGRPSVLNAWANDDTRFESTILSLVADHVRRIRGLGPAPCSRRIDGKVDASAQRSRAGALQRSLFAFSSDAFSGTVTLAGCSAEVAHAWKVKRKCDCEMTEKPYNPLEKTNLADSIARKVLEMSSRPLSEAGDVQGAGIYLLYYSGANPLYERIQSDGSVGDVPIYVGRAIPKGGRKGAVGVDAGKGRALSDRLKQHANSIDQALDLELTDFSFRCLSMEAIWIPLGESAIIHRFNPVWNIAIDGFGNKDPGERRKGQYKSPWDVLHAGREFAVKLAESPVTRVLCEGRISDHFAGLKLRALPKKALESIDDAMIDQVMDEGVL